MITYLARFRFQNIKVEKVTVWKWGIEGLGWAALDVQMTDRLGIIFEKESDCNTADKDKH